MKISPSIRLARKHLIRTAYWAVTLVLVIAVLAFALR